MTIHKKNVLMAILYIVLIAMAIWMLASIINTIDHNTPTAVNYAKYAWWNLFNLIK